MTVNEKLLRLRQAMRTHSIDAYLIPSSDPHQSEYVAEHWQARRWLSGFSGSAGLVIVTYHYAGLWTDSRYFLQAEQELQGTEIELHRQVVPHAPEHIAWLQENLPAGSTLGLDGSLFSIGQLRHLEKQLNATQIKIADNLELITDIWENRPALPADPVFAFDEKFSGESRAAKLQCIRAEMRKTDADFHLITTLDDIAWTLNLRGADVACNPVMISYLAIGKDNAFLFIQPEKVPAAIKQSLNEDGVIVKPYSEIENFLQHLAQPILIDESSINARLYRAIPESLRRKGNNLPMALKAIKNPVEIGHLRTAMRKDSVALLRFFRWLEQELSRRTISEYEVARRLDNFRRAQGDYFGESFPAIVGYNANGAIVHYRPEEATAAMIRPEGILLLDSGGQYWQGTTDITRTIALGAPTDAQKFHYTLVLKGHIALAAAKFPAGTTGVQLDTLARMHLWQHGLNYGHGTGHGIGFFLNVHESPQGFAANPNSLRGSTPHEPGMITSNEPGFYLTGAYGIRIENLLLCVPAEETEFGKFLQFETLTLFPMDTALIEAALLTANERQWLKDYHQKVLEELTPLLEAEEINWLEQRCAIAF